jgi:TPP-dependent indolepyruvate ferredoxin oxidoreductase alpha subunit
MNDMVLLGDEAVAVAGIQAGVAAAYAYPGTPSTENLEDLIRHSRQHGTPFAAWCANEETAYEEALGVSLAGRRAMTAMEHVGLNVAADPFVNSALVSVNGGLVAVVADDPGMHSSQNEQDSRYYVEFATIVCLEPATQQGAYDMTREAFDVSERFQVLVLEGGDPLIERQLRGVVAPAFAVLAKETGEVPPDGELTADIVRQAMGPVPKGNHGRIGCGTGDAQPSRRLVADHLHTSTSRGKVSRIDTETRCRENFLQGRCKNTPHRAQALLQRKTPGIR